MNAFSDTPMLTGGFDNGMRNVLLQDIIYQEYFGDSLEVGLGWLKVYGVDAIVAATHNPRGLSPLQPPRQAPRLARAVARFDRSDLRRAAVPPRWRTPCTRPTW